MCYITARIAAYDLLDGVAVVARVCHVDCGPGCHAAPLETSVVFPGEGITDSRTWLVDALTGLLEAL